MRQPVLRNNAIKLKHVKTIVKPSGKVFHYLRVPGATPVRLPDGPKDSPAFLLAYAEALNAARPAKLGTNPSRGTIAHAIQQYQQTAQVKSLKAGSRKRRLRDLSSIVEKAGSGLLCDLQAKHILADIANETPHMAQKRFLTWRLFLRWAMKEALLINSDPSANIEPRVVPKTDGHATWTLDDIHRYREYWKIGTRERLTFELLYWTAARLGDASRLRASMIDKDGWLCFRQEKTGDEVYIPVHRKLPAFARGFENDLQMLLQCLQTEAASAETWIATLKGTHRDRSALSNWFSQSAIKVGVVKTAHGLRKARATALAEAGATAHQIAAWTGHRTLVEVQRYASAANKRRLLSDAATTDKG
jgi:integrase